MSEEKGIITANFETVTTGLAALGTPENMRKSLDLNAQRLQVVHDYIKDNFQKNVDYGKTDERSNKDCLMKPGAEKICKLFNTTPQWSRDNDTWEMLGKPAGTICFVCAIIDNATGNVIGEGRGAAKVGDKKRDANKAIKNAEKCSLVDAALYTFNLSSMFTQDIADKQNLFNKEKNDAWTEICDARVGVESSMSNADFWKKIAKDFCHGEPRTTGAIRALKEAVFNGVFDLATGERLPEEME